MLAVLQPGDTVDDLTPTEIDLIVAGLT